MTYVSEGSFELTVQLTGNEETPKAEDFSIVPCSDESSGFHFKWDTTEKGDMIFNRAKSSFNITGIRAGEKADTYVLTVDYTTTGAMEAIYAKTNWHTTTSCHRIHSSTLTSDMVTRALACRLPPLKRAKCLSA